MADITDTFRSFAVGQRVQFYLSFFDERPKWYQNATIIASNPQKNTFDIEHNFTVPAKSVKPLQGYELNVGEICEYIQSEDGDGNVLSTMPHTIISKHHDRVLGELFYLTFTQRGMRPEHLHVQPPETDVCITLILAVNPVAMVIMICLSMIICTDNVISHDETGT